MSQTQFEELMKELEDIVLNKEIDINNSPKLKKSLESIISKYVGQEVNQVKQDNYNYYSKRSNQAISEMKKQTKDNFAYQFKSINQEIDSLNHKVNHHSRLTNKINKSGNSLKYISNQITQIQSENHKSNLILKISKSRFLMIISSSLTIGIALTMFLFILIKLF